MKPSSIFLNNFSFAQLLFLLLIAKNCQANTTTLSITTPTDYENIPAGQLTPIYIEANPPGFFTLTLDCVGKKGFKLFSGSSGTKSVNNVPSGASKFLVPNDFGGDCVFALSNYDNQVYPVARPVPVRITQQLVFAQPTGLIANPFEPLPILVQTATNVSFNVSGSVSLTCSSGTTSIHVTINTLTSIINNGNYGGSCTLDTDEFPSYFLNASIQIALIVVIGFESVPTNFVQGKQFEFIVKTVSVPSVPVTADFELTCNGSMQTLSNVQFNTIQTFTPNFTFSASNGPFSCVLSNAQNAFFSKISYSAPLLVPLDQAEQATVAKSLAIAGGGFGFA